MSVVCSGAQTVAVKRLCIGGEEKKGERTREEKKHTTYTTQHTPKDERGETMCMCPNTHAPLPFKAETVAQLSLSHTHTLGHSFLSPPLAPTPCFFLYCHYHTICIILRYHDNNYSPISSINDACTL